MTFDPAFRIRHLGFHGYLKSQKLPEINAKSSHNTFETYEFASFDKVMKKTKKNTELCQKNLWPKLHEI